jgi:hypothetical protein
MALDREHERKEVVMPITVAAYTPNVKPGAYQAVCTGVQTKATKDGGEFRVWDFTLGNGQTVSGSSSLATSPKSKGGKWLAALVGHTPEAGESVEPVGQRCTIIVALKDETGYEYVETVAAPDGTSLASASSHAQSFRSEAEAAESIHKAQEDPTPFPGTEDELPF